MKNLYKAVQSRLVDLSEQPQGNALKRLNKLSGFICGMIRKGNSNLPDIGSGLPQDIDADSKTMAAKRFISHCETTYKVHFLPFLTAFLKGISSYSCFDNGFYLVIDGSQIGKTNGALMISLHWNNRGIPICWMTKSGGKGHFKAEDHEKLFGQAVKILQEILPDNKPVTLLGDGEFDGIGLQKICSDAHWNYVLRSAINTVLYEQGDEFQAKHMDVQDQESFIFIPQVEFTKERFKYVNFVYWHEKQKYENPIVLISNLLCPHDIIAAYQLRYSIECLFKDLKSTSFNLHKTRLQHPAHVNNLILIAALAFLFLTVLAIEYDKPKYRKKVQRVRKDRKVLSFFSFAFRLIDFFIEQQFDLQFSFDFSMNFESS